MDPEAPSSSSILLGSQIDPSTLHPLASILDNQHLDYLLLEDDKLSSTTGPTALPTRGWADELCYGTGSTYLAGLAAGGLWGFREGLTKTLAPRSPLPTTLATALDPTAKATAPLASSSSLGAQAQAFAKSAVPPPGTAGAKDATDRIRAQAASAGKISSRLRWNNVLNAVTRRGSFTGNSAGVLALIYNGFNSTLDSYRGGHHDIYGSMLAGAATGALWKCTAGLQPMLITSGLLTVGAAGWTTLKTQFL